MKVILHEPRWHTTKQSKILSIFGLLVSLFTDSAFSHASIVDNNGIRYDSSFMRGSFGFASLFSPKSKRRILVFDCPTFDITEQHLKRFQSYPYDYIGVLFWKLGLHIEKRWFCFEAARELMHLNGIYVDTKSGLVSGKDIRRTLEDKGYQGVYMTEGEYQ